MIWLSMFKDTEIFNQLEEHEVQVFNALFLEGVKLVQLSEVE